MTTTTTTTTTRMIIPKDKMEQSRTTSKPNKKAALVLTTTTFAALALLLLAFSCVVDAFSFGKTATNPTRPNVATVTKTPLGRSIANTNQHLQRNLVRLYETPNNNSNDSDSDSDDINSSKNTPQPAKRNTHFESLLVAAAFVTASLDTSGILVANAAAAATAQDLSLVSPGTPLIETKTASGDMAKIVASTEHTLNSLADTALLNSGNRKQLTESVKRIQTNINTELTSVQAWKEVLRIIQDYGVDLQKETTVVVRPPADVLRLLDDVTSKQQFNVLINGEIVQLQLDYQKGINTKEQLEAGEPIQPDDEWVLRIRGYKGFDPTAPTVAQKEKNKAKYERRRPEWFRNLDKYWHAELPSNTPLKTRGDVIVVGGTVTIALSYAASYAYYLDQIEQEESKAKEKQAQLAKKKKAAAAAAAAKKEAEEKANEEETASKKGWLGRKQKAKPAEKKVEKTKKETTTKEVEAKKEFIESKEEETTKEEKPEEKEPVAVEEPKKEIVEEKKEEPVAVVEEKPPIKEEPEPVEEPPQVPEPEPVVEDPPSAIDSNPESDDTSDDDKEDDSVKVVIDFDKDGKVVIKVNDDDDDESTIDKRGGTLAFVQALYFPWLGWFVSSSPSYDDRSKFMKFTQALLCPWAGIFFPKDWSTTKMEFGDDGDGDGDDDDKKK